MENISLLASEIADQTIQLSWPYFALVVLLSMLSSAVGAYFSSYFTQRAKHKAIAVDFDEIKSQLKETTSLTETIRTDLQHEFNRKHTIEVLKREKLEAYIQKITQAYENLSRETEEKVLGLPVKFDTGAYTTATLIQAMYLPEFDEVQLEFNLAYVEFRKWIGKGMKYRLIKTSETGNLEPIKQPDEDLNLYSSHLGKVLEAISSIEHKAKEVGRNLIAEELRK